jgi:hypothetical protein
MRSKTKSEIMSKAHWAIVRNVTTHHPGDERSRTNPGHQPTQLWMLRTSNLRDDHKKLVERVANES